jgi:hypothetical protein
MTDSEQLKKLSVALGKLAPKGTWFCEILENIWWAESQEEANKIAEDATEVFRNKHIESLLWIGNREDSN